MADTPDVSKNSPRKRENPPSMSVAVLEENSDNLEHLSVPKILKIESQSVRCTKCSTSVEDLKEAGLCQCQGSTWLEVLEDSEKNALCIECLWAEHKSHWCFEYFSADDYRAGLHKNQQLFETRTKILEEIGKMSEALKERNDSAVMASSHQNYEFFKEGWTEEKPKLEKKNEEFNEVLEMMLVKLKGL